MRASNLIYLSFKPQKKGSNLNLTFFDENLLKACDSAASIYWETHFHSFEPYISYCIKCFPAIRLLKWNIKK